ncbi:MULTISPECIES: hypothetical protein [Glycomyces]|uniref:Uncharacterized protein n=2 Tax=Glycomyces TaxID=58113 RepID=A0A9X3PHA6_9ACTN|nr:hypothetical protein [Glycomyces lechevalierae]MDA1383636.1 hypothetical protein [Glycomyces lechevalierae]MDR7341374.1 hypothetical protein [Glycomyces lechevalierae]
MAELHCTDTHLTVRLTGVRRAFGRRRPLMIPLAAVTAVRADPAAARAFPGARWGVATNIPGVVNVGSFRRGGKRDFWDVANPDLAIVVELEGARYDRLLLEVDDPVAGVAEILAAVEASRR